MNLLCVVLLDFAECTQEIAVFRAFAEVVDKAEDQVVVIDTAPTGHTLLLLDSTQSYWINKVDSHTNGQFALISWRAVDIKGENLLTV